MFFQKLIINLYYFSVALFLSLPLVTSATTHGDDAVTAVTLKNPLNVDNITDLLVALLNIVIIIAVPIVVFFIIYAGFLYVTARGNAEQVKKASAALTYSVIGAILIIGAFVIVEIIGNLVDSFTA